MTGIFGDGFFDMEDDTPVGPLVAADENEGEE